MEHSHNNKGGFLHSHPGMAKSMKLPQDHVIVDRKDWEEALILQGQLEVLADLPDLVAAELKISIVLIRTLHGFLPRVVQKVQMKKDPVSGIWNHSGVRVRYEGVDSIFEASWKEWEENIGKMKNAGAYFNKMSNYLGHPDKYEILEIEIPIDIFQGAILESILKYEGTPYDFGNLLLHQIVYYIWDKWIGRTPDMATKTMVCHEITMNVINEMYDRMGKALPFLNPHQAQVSDIYHKPWERKRIQ